MASVTQAVILAGGKGTRLASVLGGKPKPLVNVGGTPLLEWQIRLLLRHGIDNIVVLVNHEAQQIERFVAGLNRSNARISIIDDGKPRGTAGAVLAVLDRLADRFLVVYGDTMINVDLTRFIDAHRRGKFDATLFIHPNDHPQDSDIVEVGDDGLIRAFHPYPHPPGSWLPNAVNAALYVIEKEALIPFASHAQPCDFAKELFPEMLDAGARLGAYQSFEYVKDVGTPERLSKVERHLASGLIGRANLGRKQRAVFLDRDGTINVHAGFIRDIEALRLLPDVGEAVRRLNDLEYRVVIATNQPVVARGELTMTELRRFHAKLETLLAQSGAYLDAILVCPHHPDRGFAGEVAALKIDCDCRKPKIGLVVQAVDLLNIDIEASWFVGDTTSDMLTAKNAGLHSILVRTGEAGQDGKYEVTPDFVADNLLAAVDVIAGSSPVLR